jgi:hypothetical protein
MESSPWPVSAAEETCLTVVTWPPAKFVLSDALPDINDIDAEATV